MKYLLIVISILTVLNACSQSKQENRNKFIPDTTVNKELKLLHSKSIELAIGDQTGKLIEDEEASRIQFRNTGNNQYLTLYHLSGSNVNSFNKFEIGVLKEKSNLYQPIKFDFFETESGIRIGIGLKELIRIKGKDYTKAIKNGFVVINYGIKNGKNIFLKNYNMPVYNAEYYFKNDKLEKFSFGFPNL